MKPVGTSLELKSHVNCNVVWAICCFKDSHSWKFQRIKFKLASSKFLILYFLHIICVALLIYDFDFVIDVRKNNIGWFNRKIVFTCSRTMTVVKKCFMTVLLQNNAVFSLPTTYKNKTLFTKPYCLQYFPPPAMIYFKTIANLMHDISRWSAPSPLRALFMKSNEVHRYNTRSAAKGNFF